MKHSYACKILRDNNRKIFVGGQQILNGPYQRSFPKHKTLIKKGNFSREFLGDEVRIQKVVDIDEIYSRFGFKVIKFDSNNSYANQRKGYKLVREYINSRQQLQRMPVGHYAEVDLTNKCIRLCGKNVSLTGKQEWIPLRESRNFESDPYKSRYNISKSLSSARKRIGRLKPSSFNKVEYFNIPDKVIGITDEGYILAIPESKSTDMPFIEAYGSRGQGKSMLLDSLEDGFFNKDESLNIHVNDIKPETHTRCMPWDSPRFLNELRRFGEQTIPKPAVYLHPTTSHPYAKIHEGEVGFDISIPAKDLFRDEDLLMYNPEWKMKRDTSALEFKKLVERDGHLRTDGLINAKSFVEAVEIIQKEVREKGMQDKITRVIADIFNSNIIDKSSGVDCRWVLEEKGTQVAENAWNICMMAGLYPHIVTRGIRDLPWFPLWLRYIINDILNFAAKYKANVMISLDEVAPLMKDKFTRAIIERAIRECRTVGVGLISVGHAYKDVPEQVHIHASYTFVFKTTEEKLITKLINQYGLKRLKQDIPSLKQFECYAFGNFNLYDSDGNKLSNEGRPQKIVRIKPPNCQHYGGI